MKKLKKFLLIFLICWVLLGVNLPLFAQNEMQDARQLVKEAHELIGETEAPKRKDFELAFQKLEEAIRLDSRHYEAYVRLARAKRDYSIRFFKKKEELELRKPYVDKAESLIKNAISIAPDRSEAYYIYLLLLQDHETDVKRRGFELTPKEKRESKEVMRKLYELDPNNIDVMTWRGYELIEEGKVKEGIPLVLKGMRGDTGQILANKRNLASKLKEKGYHKEAEEILSGVEREEKYYEGVSEIRYGDIDKGLKIIKESLDGDISKLQKWQKKSLARTLKEKKRYKKAAEIYELIDPEKYKRKIKELREKAKEEENWKQK